LVSDESVCTRFRLCLHGKRKTGTDSARVAQEMEGQFR
jgi:hypothetical protein